jgi:hypothetical protein
LGDLKEARRYWKLKEEAQDRTLWRTQFGRGYGPVSRLELDPGKHGGGGYCEIRRRDLLVSGVTFQNLLAAYYSARLQRCCFFEARGCIDFPQEGATFCPSSYLTQR